MLRAAIYGLFEMPVGVAVTDPRMAQPDVYPSEAVHIVRARAARQREFAAGRRAVRLAMQDAGLPDVAIPATLDRAPIWPTGIAGTISHAQTLCVAAVSVRAESIGIDLEEASPLEAHLLPDICSQAELLRIAGPDQGVLAKLIFCAKEAAYKAQYPLTTTLFGFDHFDVTLNVQECTFVAIFRAPAGRFKVDDMLAGRFAHVADHFVTAVTIGCTADTGV